MPVIIPRPLKWIAFAVGTVIALYGVALLAIVAAGSVNAGHVPLTVSGVSALFAATPLLALPFSSRVARTLLGFVLLGFGAGMLWRAFGGIHPPIPTVCFKVAAVCFVTLLLARLGVAWRRGSRPRE